MTEITSIVKEPNKVLRVSAKELDRSQILASRIQKLITNMKITLKNTPSGVGLAAPQVGESLRIFIVSEEAEEIDKLQKERWEKVGKEWKRKTKNPEDKREWKYYVFINPIVKKISQKKIEGPEGCLSVADKFGLVRRHEKITVEAYNEQGEKFTRGAAKFFARVMQHELDHLNGTLFIDKVQRFLKPDEFHKE